MANDYKSISTSDNNGNDNAALDPGPKTFLSRSGIGLISLLGGFVLFLSAIFVCVHKNGSMDPSVSDYQQVVNTLSRMHFALDSADWEAFKTCYDSIVHMNYMGTVADVTPEEIVETFKDDILSTVHSHHQLGNVVVDVDLDKRTAKAMAYLTATFQMEESISTFFAIYEFGLVKKKNGDYVVSASSFQPKWQQDTQALNITSFGGRE